MTFRKPTRLLYAGLATFIFIASVAVAFASNALSLDAIVPITLLALALATAGLKQPLTEASYVVIFVLLSFLGISQEHSLFIFGTYAVVITWIAQGKLAKGIVSLLCSEIVFVSFSEHKSLFSLMSLFSTAIVLLIGFTVFKYRRMTIKAKRQAEIARHHALTASSAVRAELSQILHDTTARDLSLIAITAQNLRATAPEAFAADIAAIEETARTASQRLRPLILKLNAEDHRDDSIESALQTASQMLATRRISLEVSGDSTIDLGTCTRIVSLIIREAAANILKYAPEKSIASIEFVQHDGNLEVSIVNAIDDLSESTSDHSSGFGLTNLNRTVTEIGGEFSFAAIASTWILLASIPLPPATTIMANEKDA